MAEVQLQILCFCGKRPKVEIRDNCSNAKRFDCESRRCSFLLEMTGAPQGISIPDTKRYKCRYRNFNGEYEIHEFTSFRSDEKAWLEHRKKIPEMTVGDVLKGTEDYLMPFKSCYCRAIANSIPRTNKELPQIKLLMGIEAKHIIKWCKAIVRTRKEDMKLRVAIDKYFNEARLLLDEDEVEKTWQLMLINMKNLPTSINILNILSDDLRKSEIWDYCVKDIARHSVNLFSNI